MKFIHCSDIHLDSKMEQHLSAAQARERNAECCATFARLVRYAAEQDVTAVLIAGDMFDTERASAQTANFVLSRIAGAPEVDFLYLRGNHDEAKDVFEGIEKPENLKTFGNRWESIRCKEAVITPLDGTMRLCVDGEIVDAGEVTMQMMPMAVNVLVPKAKEL